MTASLNTRIQDLKSEIEAAHSDLIEINANIARWQSEQKEIVIADPAGYCGPLSDPHRRRSAVMDQISSAEAHKESRQMAIKVLEKRLAFLTKADSSSFDVVSARAEYAAACDEEKSLVTRLGQVETRMAEMQAEVGRAQQEAAGGLTAASRDFAQAVADGKGDHQQAQIFDAFKEAQSTADDVDRWAQGQITALTALKEQQTMLRAECAAAQEQGKEALRILSLALEAKYALEWDHALENLAAAGARVVAARSLGGRRTHWVLGTKSSIDRMEPGRAALTEEEINRLAKRVVLPEAP